METLQAVVRHFFWRFISPGTLFGLTVLFAIWVQGCGSSSSSSSGSSTTPTSVTVSSCSSDLPTLSAKTPEAPKGYTGDLYAGQLYDTWLQFGDGSASSVIQNRTQLISNMDRNNVIRAIANVSVDATDSLDLSFGTGEGLDQREKAWII